MPELSVVEVGYPGPQGPRGVPRILRDAVELAISPYATFYLSPDGDDTNTGLTADTAFATFDYAWNYIASLRWTGGLGFPALELANGVDYTTTASTSYDGPLILFGCDGVYVYSDSGDPTDVVLDTGGWLVATNGCSLSLVSITLKNAEHIIADGGNIDLDSCNYTELSTTGGDLFHARRGGSIVVTGTSTLAFTGGTPSSLFRARQGGEIYSTAAFTITGSPAFSLATAWARDNGFIRADGTTFSGTVTGKRYQAEVFGKIYTAGGGANFFSGNSVGSADGTSTYA